jgi:glucose/mannose transport system substrate-binding protein
MQPLNDLYAEEEWEDKFPEELLELISQDGNIYSVPVNIHRGNVLWYNKAVFEEHGLEAPTTFDEFFEVAEALQAEGVTPLALGDNEPWTAVHLLETVLLGTLGSDGYNSLWSGELSFDSPEVREALENFDRMLEYINDDHAALNWQDAAQLVANGEAAMNVMGDWVAGYYTVDLELEANEDFGWVPTPNSAGTFMVITDNFGLPEGAPNPEQVTDFLRVLGSVEGQDTFNPLKGSIPARVDADPGEYGEYGAQTIEEFKESDLSLSLAHNSAAPPNFTTQIQQEVNILVSSRNIDQFVETVSGLADQEIEE